MHAHKGRRKEKTAPRKPVKTDKKRLLDDQTDDDLAALAEDCERDMYGDDYDYLKISGWLDR